MLSGDGNENGKISKYIFINRSNKQKKKIQLCTCSTPFVKVLYRCFARLQKLPSHTFYGGNALCVPVHFFVTAAHVHLGGR